jgi:signal transduction histidine kinase
MSRLTSTPTACQARCRLTSLFAFSEFCRKPFTILQNTAEFDPFEVRLWGVSGEIHLTVRDSGLGFDWEAAKESRGIGLISMEERLKLVNGTFSIASQPKRGTTIHARVPVTSGSDAMRVAG